MSQTPGGTAGLLTLVPGWALPAGAAGGLFLLIAGLMHVGKKGKNPKETLTTWLALAGDKQPATTLGSNCSGLS